MAYTSFETMRQRNSALYGINGPAEPYLTVSEDNDNDLKSAALRFLHNRCEKLKFNGKIEQEEADSGKFQGTGAGPNQIPYNMQMDINRLCLERSLETFIDSGVAEDAYDVYYCYLEMFFGRYGKSKKMVELLSEFEANGSSLLMKHRDHYSHSVYVFALGLAIYETNKNFRDIFKEKYGFGIYDDDKDEDRRAADFFLEFWGLTSLFHDIGYPFELPFEQSLSYYEVEGEKRGKGKKKPYLAYNEMEMFVSLTEKEQVHLRSLFGKTFRNTEELLAWGVTRKLGEKYGITEEYLLEKIHNKPCHPDAFGYYMDHAYFSAVRLYHEIVKDPANPDRIKADIIRPEHLDALTAILLHNSLYKFAIAFYKTDNNPLPMDLHPLAFLLMLCDELQCWDRTAYGRNSRIELHPMGVDFDFSGNAISAVYHFDENEHEKINKYKAAYQQWENQGEKGDAPRLKDFSDMSAKEQRFTSDIKRIVDTSLIPLTVTQDMEKVDRSLKHTYLSSSNFLHLYDFAVALNARFYYQGAEEKIDNKVLESEFEQLSLEYQLSNIHQAKGFSKSLNALGCFFTDRPVDYDMVTEFLSDQMDIIAPMEHERWIREHISMGWIYGDIYEKIPVEKLGLSEEDPEKEIISKALREQFRMHKLTMDGSPTNAEINAHFRQLPPKEQGKDVDSFNSMLKLIQKFDGLRIYHLNNEILEGAAIGKISKNGRDLLLTALKMAKEQAAVKGKLTGADHRKILEKLLESIK